MSGPNPGDVYALTVEEVVQPSGMLRRLLVKWGLTDPPTRRLVYLRLVEEVSVLSVFFRTPDDTLSHCFGSDFDEWAAEAVLLADKGIPESAETIREYTGSETLPFDLSDFTPTTDPDELKVGGTISED